MTFTFFNFVSSWQWLAATTFILFTTFASHVGALGDAQFSSWLQSDSQRQNVAGLDLQGGILGVLDNLVDAPFGVATGTANDIVASVWGQDSSGNQISGFRRGVAAASVFLTVVPVGNVARGVRAVENVVYREISAVDRLAFESGQPLVPRGIGGSILDHVRGQPTRHISASQTIEETTRFNGGNGLVAIDIDAATSGGTRFIPHSDVIESIGARPKQVLKVLESGEVLFEGPIPASAVRRIRLNNL